MNILHLLAAAAIAFTTLAAEAETRAEIDTNMGKIQLSLDEQKAPKTVANFVGYAQKGFYNGTIFHRVIDSFMIQGGGFTRDMQQKPTEKAIVNEADNGLKNAVGTIAMARTASPNSATSQFFINLADNDFLNQKSSRPQDAGYAVFGKVTGGMDVVKRIGKAATGDYSFYQNVPTQAIVINKVTILK